MGWLLRRGDGVECRDRKRSECGGVRRREVTKIMSSGGGLIRGVDGAYPG